MSNKYEAGVRVSEYVLEEHIGTGTFGEVWRGKHHIWNELVAIKLPTEPEYVRYLRREGVVVHGLRHPNIVGVKGLDPYADIPYLVMELVEGPALREVIDQHKQGLPIDTALTILRGILRAIVVAQENGVLHRDLKPGNVLLDLKDKPLDKLVADDVKVSDFGLGVANTDTLRSIAQSASMDRDNRIVGTLAYMAPELRDGHGKASPKSDLYSIGVLLFEMLTGERPAGAELPSTIRAETPEAFDEIFRKLYARLDRRYDTAQAALDELEALLKSAPTALKRRKRSGKLPPIPKADQAGTCPACGHAAESYDQFCTQCSHQMVERVRKCTSCGAFPGPQDKFCIFCGMSLADA